MKLDVFGIIGNLTSVHSKELMRKHMEHPDFDSVWSTFTILRYLSFSDAHARALQVEAISSSSPGRLLYPVFMELFDTASSKAPYQSSPFRRVQ